MEITTQKQIRRLYQQASERLFVSLTLPDGEPFAIPITQQAGYLMLAECLANPRRLKLVGGLTQDWKRAYLQIKARE